MACGQLEILLIVLCQYSPYIASSFATSSFCRRMPSSLPGRLLLPPFKLLVSSVSMSNIATSSARAMPVEVEDWRANVSAVDGIMTDAVDCQHNKLLVRKWSNRQGQQLFSKVIVTIQPIGVLSNVDTTVGNGYANYSNSIPLITTQIVFQHSALNLPSDQDVVQRV